MGCRCRVSGYPDTQKLGDELPRALRFRNAEAARYRWLRARLGDVLELRMPEIGHG